MIIDLYIPACNAAHTLPDVLTGAQQQTRPPNRIVVIDDGSTDETAMIARSAGSELIAHNQNRGLAVARNTALAWSRADVLIGVDADVVLGDTFVETVEAAFVDSSLVALCGRLDERFHTSLADRWRAAHMTQHYGDHDVENPRFLFGSTTAARVEALRRVGGWNKKYCRNGEDVDLSRRLAEEGFQTRYLAGAKAEHLRRDQEASVLTGFWNWFRPAGEDRGEYEDWLSCSQRIDPVTLGVVEHRLRQDRGSDRSSLLGLTAVLAWWMTICDIRHLAETRAVDRVSAQRVARRVMENSQACAKHHLRQQSCAAWMQLLRLAWPEAMRSDEGNLDGGAADFLNEFKREISKGPFGDAETWRHIGEAWRQSSRDESRGSSGDDAAGTTPRATQPVESRA